MKIAVFLNVSPSYISFIDWMSSFSSGRFAVYKIKSYKNTADNELKKLFLA